MRLKPISLAVLFCIFSLILSKGIAFAQERTDREEVAPERAKLQKEQFPLRFSSNAAVFSGYDSNVNLSPVSKGAVFEEGLFSASLIKPWKYDLKFTFDYDLDGINYNQVSDATNILNHLRFGLHKKVMRNFTIGTGYDFSAFYYPNDEDGDFLLQKCFFYVKNNLTRKLYHQVMVEAGYKNHLYRKALSDDIGTYQDKKLVSRRQIAEYKVGYFVNKNLSLGIKGRFTKNDSNAKYQNFYDYKTYEVSPSANYRITKKMDIFASFSYIERNYKSRLVALKDYKEKDKIYSTTSGLRYALNNQNILSLIYTYRNNDSNEPLEKYTENVISVGWQYNF